jgi:hypothetical protein
MGISSKNSVFILLILLLKKLFLQKLLYRYSCSALGIDVPAASSEALFTSIWNSTSTLRRGRSRCSTNFFNSSLKALIFRDVIWNSWHKRIRALTSSSIHIWGWLGKVSKARGWSCLSLRFLLTWEMLFSQVFTLSSFTQRLLWWVYTTTNLIIHV